MIDGWSRLILLLNGMSSDVLDVNVDTYVWKCDWFVSCVSLVCNIEGKFDFHELTLLPVRCRVSF